LTHFCTRLSLALALIGHIACSNAAVDKAVGTTDRAATIVVARTETGISLQNRAGRPLLNIRAAIETRDGAVFLHTLPTLDAGVTREVRFAEFRTEEGVLFEPSSVVPTQVKTAARDTLGNNYDVTTPWERGPAER
jgi:hypothetical protein